MRSTRAHRIAALAAFALAGLADGAPAQLPVQSVALDEPLLALQHAAATYDPVRERVVMFGGIRYLDYGLSEGTWEWDGQRWRFRPVGSPPPARIGHRMAFDVARRRAVLFGGRSDFNSSGLDDTWEWDGEDWVERVPVIRPPARFGHGMAYDRRRQVTVLFGGDAQGLGRVGDTWEWDGTVWRIRANGPPGPSGRSNPGMAYDWARDRTVLFGGWDQSGNWTGDTWEWDGAVWRPIATVTSPGAGNYQLVFDPWRGRILAWDRFGGTWEYDGNDWTSRGGSVPDSENAVLAFEAARGRAVLFGGWDRRQLARTGSRRTWTWDGASWTQAREEQGMAPRLVVTDPAGGRVVGLGVHSHGYDFFDEPFGYDALSTWDGLTWAERLHPDAVADEAMVFDSGRGRTVRFGGWLRFCRGRGCGPSYAVSEWDGTSENWFAPDPHPVGRVDHAMAYDAARGETVLFGGNDWSYPNVLPTDTWTWDGTAWTDRTPAVSPPGRANHGMAFDPVRARTVLFGGDSLADTWEWDGTNWQHLQSTHSPPAGPCALAWDPRQGMVVAYAGTGLWGWGGTDWALLSGAQSLPAASAATSMAYDPARGALLVVNGYSALSIGDGIVPAAVNVTGQPGCPGSGNAAAESASLPRLGAPAVDLVVDDMAAASVGGFFLAMQRADLPVANCRLLVGTPLVGLAMTTNDHGHGAVSFPIPLLTALRGTQLFAQAAIVASSGSSTFLQASRRIELLVGD